MNDKPITLSFTAQQLDYIATVLGQRPWVEANPLLLEIQRQVQAQQVPQHPVIAPRGANGQDHAPGALVQQ